MLASRRRNTQLLTSLRSDVLHQVLEAFHESTPGVRASVLANADGLLMLAHPSDGTAGRATDTAESVAATTAVLLGLADQTLSRLAQGEVQRVIVEGELGVVGIFPVSRRTAFAVLYAKDVKLGLALYASRRCAKELQTILEIEAR